MQCAQEAEQESSTTASRTYLQQEKIKKKSDREGRWLEQRAQFEELGAPNARPWKES